MRRRSCFYFCRELVKSGGVSREEIERIDDEVRTQADQAAPFRSGKSRLPDAKAALTFLMLEEVISHAAKNEFLVKLWSARSAKSWKQDRRVVLIGGRSVSSGPAQASIRPSASEVCSRMKSPPIAEIGFLRHRRGTAMAGLRPLVDIATRRFPTKGFRKSSTKRPSRIPTPGGQTNVPVTYFMRYGIRGGGGVQHSGKPAAVVLEHSGLQVAMPSAPPTPKACCAPLC